MKLLILSLTSLLFLSNAFATKDPPKVCQGRTAGHSLYLSAMKLDVHFVVAGKLAPTRFIQCNYVLRRNGQVQEETELWCRDTNHTTYGPFPMKLTYENTGRMILHRIESIGDMDQEIGIESWEASYPIYGGFKGKFNITMKGKTFNSKSRCNQEEADE